ALERSVYRSDRTLLLPPLRQGWLRRRQSQRAPLADSGRTGVERRRTLDALMDRLKIAIIRQKDRPDGGGERFGAPAPQALGERGVELTVLAREWSGADKVRVIPCNPPYRGRVGRERSFAEAACRMLRNHHFDLVQSHERVPCGDIYRAGDGVHREWLRQ